MESMSSSMYGWRYTFAASVHASFLTRRRPIGRTSVHCTSISLLHARGSQHGWYYCCGHFLLRAWWLQTLPLLYGCLQPCQRLTFTLPSPIETPHHACRLIPLGTATGSCCGTCWLPLYRTAGLRFFAVGTKTLPVTCLRPSTNCSLPVPLFWLDLPAATPAPKGSQTTGSSYLIPGYQLAAIARRSSSFIATFGSSCAGGILYCGSCLPGSTRSQQPCRVQQRRRLRLDVWTLTLLPLHYLEPVVVTACRLVLTRAYCCCR